ncbi:DUF1269 domain-containing protein [Roseomonas sp. CCTCC AB2023176]|uniref:DUF1269 domain-containing protein n=1 Tax=Roseomonas sp. CCTCC AB2023176 TaxID=3342640 RepID=UPI0035D82716
MADLLVIAYANEAAAEDARKRVLSLQSEYLIELGDAVVAVKEADGTVRLNQLFSPTAAGAASGALWGSLIGLIVLMPLVGATLGAASGALAGRLTDVGIKDDLMRDIAATLDSGEAGLFLLIRKMTTDKVMAGLSGTGGRVMRSSFDETKEATLREALEHAQAATRAAPATAPGSV